MRTTSFGGSNCGSSSPHLEAVRKSVLLVWKKGQAGRRGAAVLRRLQAHGSELVLLLIGNLVPDVLLMAHE